MRRLATLFLVFGIVVFSAGAALAQSVGATNGAINGKVTDASAGGDAGRHRDHRQSLHAGRAHRGHQRGRHLPLPGDSTR